MRSGPRPREPRRDQERKYGQVTGPRLRLPESCGYKYSVTTTIEWYVLAGKQCSNNAVTMHQNPAEARSVQFCIAALLQDCKTARDDHQLTVRSTEYGKHDLQRMHQRSLPADQVTGRTVMESAMLLVFICPLTLTWSVCSLSCPTCNEIAPRARVTTDEGRNCITAGTPGYGVATPCLPNVSHGS
jgi:hypothetical protein